MSSSVYSRLLSASVLSIPPIILFNDTFYSIYKINNDSMEPLLKQNDIVLVRKVDFFPYYKNQGIDVDDLQGESNSTKIEEETDRIKSISMDESVGKTPIHRFTVWSSPPILTPGDIVVFKNPQTFSTQLYDCARVIGLGGQRVRPKDSYSQIVNIRPYSIWVENNSETYLEDSRKFGSISKRLIMGNPVQIIWPPSRFGKVSRMERPAVGRAWWP